MEAIAAALPPRRETPLQPPRACLRGRRCAKRWDRAQAPERYLELALAIKPPPPLGRLRRIHSWCECQRSSLASSSRSRRARTAGAVRPSATDRCRPRHRQHAECCSVNETGSRPSAGRTPRACCQLRAHNHAHVECSCPRRCLPIGCRGMPPEPAVRSFPGKPSFDFVSDHVTRSCREPPASVDRAELART